MIVFLFACIKVLLVIVYIFQIICGIGMFVTKDQTLTGKRMLFHLLFNPFYCYWLLFNWMYFSIQEFIRDIKQSWGNLGE